MTSIVNGVADSNIKWGSIEVAYNINRNSSSALNWARYAAAVLVISAYFWYVPSVSAQGQSVPITGLTFDETNINRLSNGTDIWPVTWGADNLIYTAGGDGDGCDGIDTRGLDIDTLSGGPADELSSQCREIYSEVGILPKGLISLSGKLYGLFQERGDQNGDGKQFQAAKICSSTFGDVWDCTGWIYEAGYTFAQGMLINHGKDNADARDQYVYMVGMDSDASSGLFDSLTLARIPNDSMKDVATHEYYAGVSADGTLNWTSSLASRQPIHSNPDSIHWGATISFNTVLRRYLLCYFRDNSANLSCYDGPDPWGPWTEVYSGRLVDSDQKFSVFFVNKNDGVNDWLSKDGKTWSFLVSGLGKWDSLNVMTARINVPTARPNPSERLDINPDGR